jgi:hypothetical protein
MSFVPPLVTVVTRRCVAWCFCMILSHIFIASFFLRKEGRTQVPAACSFLTSPLSKLYLMKPTMAPSFVTNNPLSEGLIRYFSQNEYALL